MLWWNKALWLEVPSQTTIFDPYQSECLISVKSSYAMQKMFCVIGSPLIRLIFLCSTLWHTLSYSKNVSYWAGKDAT